MMWNCFGVDGIEAAAAADADAGVVDVVPTVPVVSPPFAYLLAASHYSNQ